MANQNGSRLVTGTLDFSGGIDSGRVTTIQSPGNPTGLKPNQLAWGTNLTVRGGGASQRLGWSPRVLGVDWPGIYQGGFIYDPRFDAFPYLILSIGGRIYKVTLDTYQVTDLSATFGLTNPPNEPQAFFVQGEDFLVIQAGDLVTLPLFWDGTTLRRSVGIVGNVDPSTPPINELPAAGPMDYFMGRIWYAFGRQYAAGDIVGNHTSGTAPYGYRDSILKVTENPLSLAGDGFIVPSNAGNIRCLRHSANLNTALGQGQLYIFTRKAVYATDVPPTRLEWQNLQEPLQRVAQIRFGTVGERTVVPVNGDLFYQSEDGIRSLLVAVRYFDQWGNVPLSREENRVLRFNDKSIMRFASGIEFDNRLWQTAIPEQTVKGVVFKAILPLDFDLISSISGRLPPVWEGALEGIDVLQLFEGDFGGRSRAFAPMVSRETGNIDIWEFTDSDRFDKQVGTDGNRVTWLLETPAYTWNDPFMLKKLDGLELWFDKMLGTILIQVDYRPDSWPCWIPWHAWKECTAKNCGEDMDAITCPNLDYATQDFYCESFKATMQLPTPPVKCIFPSGRPSNTGYQFQIRVTIKGWARVRGLLVYALPVKEAPFNNIVC